MGLYERLLQLEEPRIPLHLFQALVGERARGRLTAKQAHDAIAARSGAPLTPAEQAEFQALVATVPPATTTASKVERLLRLQEIDQVLLIVDAMTARDGNPYGDVAALKARLGV